MTMLFDWFLFDTLVWTGALIALVLVARRPVARHLGARAAYALWALPLLRLALPPLTLPAWAAPWLVPAADVSPQVATLAPATAADLEFTATLAATPAPQPAIEWTALLVAVWLAGALVFLVRRFWLYGTLRDQLLAGSRPVGSIGKVRLVETPELTGPVAFGVIDKVIALPHGFMSRADRQSRDLAIAHELQHHRGNDLLVNIMVQPLFALHWFNPLGWAGWRALRRDQEAACDARVVSGCDREGRARYAAVIAEFASRSDAAPRPALAAAMACPVLGDKSVIQRLRSLTMSDISPRRRLAARTLFGGALVSLPLTASIALAQVAEPAAPPAAPAAPEAPLPPEAPAAPEAPGTVDVEVRTISHGDDADGARHMVRVERRTDEDGRTVVTRKIIRPENYEGMSAEDRAEMERDLAEAQREIAEAMGPNSDFAKEMAKLGKDGAMQKEIRIAIAEGHRAAAEASRAAAAAAPKVVISCRNPDQPVTSTVEKGKTTLWVCKSAGERVRREALTHARSAIVSDRNLSAEERAEALRSIDEQIARAPEED